jgi:hypothetical protein
VFGIKKLLIGWCVGIVIGLWFGVNLGKDQPIYSNPFHKVSLKDRMVESGGNALEKSGQAIKRSLGK